VDPETAGRSTQLTTGQGTWSALSRLSESEQAVARLIDRGRPNSEISRELLVGVATVKA
jgi:DNA-binding NarL/FixJ family response regulator